MKIVVVEDETPIRNGIGKMVTKINPDFHLVGTASNGVEGLKVINNSTPDLVITDINMPEMDGLTMLGELRKQGMICKVIVLTAYSDFNFAQKAISLGIENYLLKPIKLNELKQALQQVYASLQVNEVEASMLSLEQMIRNLIMGTLKPDDSLNKITLERYHLDISKPVLVMSAWLGQDYADKHRLMVQLLNEVCDRIRDIEYCIVPSERYSLVFLVIYSFKDADAIEGYFDKSVVPMLSDQVRGRMICTWKQCTNMLDVTQSFDWMLDARKWNLNMGRGIMISEQKISNLNTYPLKYPQEIETQAKQMLVAENKEGFHKCFEQFKRNCLNGNFDVQDIRDAYTRFCLNLLNLAREVGSFQDYVSDQGILEEITNSLTWFDLEEILNKIYSLLLVEKNGQSEISLLVKKAGKMVEEYYSQGITLDEISRKLGVSEEYLSTQFKKETGATFTETIRKCRLNKVRELLLHTDLKLNQIAELAGYTDPKYMSKVFRDEMGMLPAEYRKLHK